MNTDNLIFLGTILLSIFGFCLSLTLNPINEFLFTISLLTFLEHSSLLITKNIDWNKHAKS
jgi:hypothetical protein